MAKAKKKAKTVTKAKAKAMPKAKAKAKPKTSAKSKTVVAFPAKADIVRRRAKKVATEVQLRVTAPVRMTPHVKVKF